MNQESLLFLHHQEKIHGKKVSILVGSLRKGSFTQSGSNVIPMFPKATMPKSSKSAICRSTISTTTAPPKPTSPLPESYTAFHETIKASDGVLFHLRKQPHHPRLPEKRSRHRLQTQRRRRTGKHARRHHQPFRRQNGRLQFAKTTVPALSCFNMPLTGQPEVFLGNSPTLFDDNGKLIESAAQLRSRLHPTNSSPSSRRTSNKTSRKTAGPFRK